MYLYKFLVTGKILESKNLNKFLCQYLIYTTISNWILIRFKLTLEFFCLSICPVIIIVFINKKVKKFAIERNHKVIGFN